MASNTVAPPESSTENLFLGDLFAPVRDEMADVELKILGQLPADLDGMLVRNGPNPLVPPGPNYHLFDGDGMLHGVRLRDGRASYSNRFVQTTSLERERATGRIHGLGVQDGAWGLVKLLLEAVRHGGLEVANKANTSLVWHHNKLLALWEGGLPYEIRPADLGTIGPCDFGGAWRHACTAHPKVDAATGEMMFFGYSLLTRAVQYGVLDRGGRLAHSTAIRLPRPVMMHDFAVTRRHTIFMDLPVTLSMARPFVGRPLVAYQPQHGARFGILPRHAPGSEVKWFEVEPCYVFHVLNACEQDDEVVVYGCRYPHGPQVLDRQRRTAESLQPDAVLHRWRFNLRTGDTQEGPLDDVPVEFPRIDDALAGRQARYGYTVSLRADGTAFVKHELSSGLAVHRSLGRGRFAGEGVFVPRGDRRGEDDGYLVAFAHDMVEDRSELLVVDCRDFDQPPLARVLMPRRVPGGFHGLWLPGSALQRAAAV